MAGFKWAESPYPTEKGIFSADVGDRTYVIEHVEPRVWSAHWYYKSKKRGGGALGVFKSRAGAEGACSNEIVRRGRANPQRRMPNLVGHPDYGIVAVGSRHLYKGTEVEVLGGEMDSRTVLVAPAGRGRPAVPVKVDDLRSARKNPSGLKWRKPNHALEWIATKNGYKLRIDNHMGTYYLMYYEPGNKKAAWGGSYASLAEAKSRAALIPQGG